MKPHLIFILLYLYLNCGSPGGNVTPELVLDVPDEIKPYIQKIILRVSAPDLFPIEVDLMKDDREFIIPTGKKRKITAAVYDSVNNILATGTTIKDIYSGRANIVSIDLHIPLQHPHLTGTIVASGVRLVWPLFKKKDDRKFASYALYRAIHSDVSDITDLLYVATKASDTTYIDKNVLDNQDYYYILYIIDNKGSFSESNTLEINFKNNEKSIEL